MGPAHLLATVSTLEALIQQYGYVAIVFGTFLEGETILLLGGFAAARDLLRIEWVIVAAFIGAVAGDQTWFQIGRHGGKSAIDRRPAWKSKAERVQTLLAKWEIPLLLGFRFLYGLRNPIPFVVGAVGYPPWRFLCLNVIGAAIWATVVAMLGYLFGETLERLASDIHRAEQIAAVAIVAIGVGAWLYFRRRHA
jgi:membrane protein DedA with SNARE-associated domain